MIKVRGLKPLVTITGVILLALTFTFTAYTATKEWTTDADFSEGTLLGTKIVGTNEAASVVLDLGGGAWYNTNWLKRAPITITNTGSALSDYQVKIIIHYDADMKSDFSDIRFTTDDGTTEIPYWIESKTDRQEAVVWVKVPSIAASGNTTIYIYYGNPSATTASNGENTFVFFDDFEPESDKWSGSSTTSDVSYSTIGNACVKGSGEFGCYGVAKLTSDVIGSGDFSVTLQIKQEGDGEEDFTFAHKFQYINDSGTYDLDSNQYPVWTEKSYTFSGNNTKLQFYIEFDTAEGICEVYSKGDNIFVRTYTSPEPTISIGEEEAQ